MISKNPRTSAAKTSHKRTTRDSTSATKKKGLSRKKTVMLLIVAALLSIGAVLLFYSLYALYDLKTLDVYLEVGDKQGFDVDTVRVSFGRAMPGTWASRELIVSQDYTRPLLVSFRVDGNVSQFVHLPDPIWVDGSEPRTVSISAYVPLNQTEGVYTGKLRVAFRRV